MFLCRAKILSIFCFVSVSSSDVKNHQRQERLFQFELKNEDVEVALDFSIPFISIPIKKTLNALTGFGINDMDLHLFSDIGSKFLKKKINFENTYTNHIVTKNLPNININPIAIGLGGLLIVLTTIFTPILKKGFGLHHFDRSSRVADYDLKKYSSFDISESLIANSRRCPERIACWISQKSTSPAVSETWNQFISNRLFSTILNTTVLEEATVKGIKGENCASFSPCPIEEKSLPKIIKSLEILTRTKFT